MPGDEAGTPRSHVDFEAFCVRWYPELLAAFTRPARAVRAEPQDVVQETIARACEWLDRLETLGYSAPVSEDEVLAWCRVVGINHVRDLGKAGYGHRERPSPSPGAAMSDPEQRAVERADLAGVLAMLPTRDAQLLFLKSQNYTHDEIAELLHLNPASVGKFLQRARIAAQEGRWWQVVAGLVPLGGKFAHSRRRVAVKPGQTVMTSVASLSLVVVFSFPTMPVTVTLPPQSPHGSTVALSGHHEAPPAVKTAMSNAVGRRRIAVTRHLVPARPNPQPRILLRRLPNACVPYLCVASACIDEKTVGDRLYLEATGPCGVQVSESVLPVCDHIGANPAVGCQRDGDPQWLVSPPPSPPSPRGNPL